MLKGQTDPDSLLFYAYNEMNIMISKNLFAW